MNCSDRNRYGHIAFRFLRCSFRYSLLTVFFLYASGFAQPQIVNFKQLQQFLPKDNVGHCIPGTPTGETSTMMGFSTSWAQVEYRCQEDSGIISIKITDLLNIPSYMSAASSVNADTIRTTPVGYERVTSYKNLKVVETYDSVSQQGKLQAYFANRFLFEINGKKINRTDILYAFLDKINLDGLRAISQDSKNNK
jgi:hypothetical protein